MDPLEFLARVLLHIPEPNKHLVRFYGVCANRVRSEKLRRDEAAEDEAIPPRRVLRKRWAQLIDYRARGPHPHAHTLRRLRACGCAEGSYRIYEVDPLTCRCGAEMRMVAFIAEPSAIRKILAHLDLKLARQRAPPEPAEPNVH